MNDMGPFYQFLGTLLLKELTQDDFSLIKPVIENLPKRYSEPMLEELYKENAYLRLRLDFTKTLLIYVHPYESVFLDPSGLLCTDVSAQVLSFYSKAGFKPDLSRARVRCGDHLGVELFFVGELLNAGRRDLATEFLKSHLLKWGPLAAMAIRDTASTKFYKTLGELIRDFLLADYEGSG